jgi:hypothetical protein
MPSDTVIVSIVGIVTSGVVGPGVAAWWARNRQHAEFEHDRETRRADDLRQVLDNAAICLGSGLSRFREAFEAEAAGQPIPAERQEWFEQAHLAHERLRLRLPEGHPVIDRYETARERLLDFAEMLEQTQGQDRGRENEATAAFEQARGEFLSEAQVVLERGAG